MLWQVVDILLANIIWWKVTRIVVKAFNLIDNPNPFLYQRGITPNAKSNKVKRLSQLSCNPLILPLGAYNITSILEKKYNMPNLWWCLLHWCHLLHFHIQRASANVIYALLHSQTTCIVDFNEGIDDCQHQIFNINNVGSSTIHCGTFY